MLKKDAIDKLKNTYEAQIRERFGERTIVYGEGNLDADIVLIGEAPGEQEEKQGKPFVGQAGKNLGEFLNVLALNREEIYITNVVKIRPYKVNEKTGRKSNRAPNRSEIESWREFLLKEIDIISPRIIVTLGNVPLKAILGEEKTIGNYHGRAIETGKSIGGISQYLFCLYHPASIIYRKELIDIYKTDLEKLKDFMTKNEVNRV